MTNLDSYKATIEKINTSEKKMSTLFAEHRSAKSAGRLTGRVDYQIKHEISTIEQDLK